MPARALTRLEAALSGLAGAPVSLERPAKAEHGDYATNAALQLAPAQRRPPRELAQELAEKAASLPEVDRAEVAGPGFVNLWLGRSWYEDALGEILETGSAYGGGFAEPQQRVQVEMVSANPTGPIVVSAARNGAYGDSVARLLAFAGNEVEREYYYNDAGNQMDLFRESVAAVREGREPPEGGYRGEYMATFDWGDGDPVPVMRARIEATLDRFRIHFDSWARQSELEQRLPELLPRIDTYELDGAVWARSSAYGDDKDQVVIRSNGLPTYRAADIAYLDDKLSRGFDRAIYVLGADHHGTRNWYAAVARMLGYDPDRVEVLLYQLVHLLRGGEAALMSKRAGDIVELDEFVDEVGIDA
ncbi:MAG TPA: arginine--tRNA ligase, partial [Gaiellaceae bacterium]|nr:arginine--tRNA ligase [Gaiellaceae bacterium]